MTPMRVLICGSRNWTDEAAVQLRVARLPEAAIVITGGAPGLDRMARDAAVMRALFAAEVICTVDHWSRFGKRAGVLRNHAMLDLQPDLVVAFQRDGSRGTQSTIGEARRRGVPVEVHAA